MENSSAHKGFFEEPGVIGMAAVVLPYVVLYVDLQNLLLGRKHHKDLRFYMLIAETKVVDGDRRATLLHLIRRTEAESLAGADGRTHWAQTDGCAVVAHVALHHQLGFDMHFGNSK